MKLGRISLSILGVTVTTLAHAWDSSGHRVVAQIAWQTLMEMHSPAAAKLQKIFAGAKLPVKDLATAATVPDQIKQARYNHSGFPTSTAFNPYHYLDRPIPKSKPFTDGNPGKNALVMLPKVEESLATDTTKQQLWDVAWICHLTGDLHQPLHSATHYWPTLLAGDHFDRGGNSFLLETVPAAEDPWKTAHPKSSSTYPNELHSFWDGLVTGGEGDGAAKVATRLMGEHPRSAYVAAELSAPAQTWADESYTLAATKVYSADIHLYQKPSDDYRAKAKKIAEEWVALAGYRLAMVLDKWLGH